MIVRTLKDLEGTEREVEGGNWESRRFLLAGDGTPFSMHDTVIRAGTETEMWYANHLEAVYCVGGRGSLENVEDGAVYPIEDGTLYALDGHERHILRAETDLRMVCVFTPPLVGAEVHDENGVYPLLQNNGR